MLEKNKLLCLGCEMMWANSEPCIIWEINETTITIKLGKTLKKVSQDELYPIPVTEEYLKKRGYKKAKYILERWISKDNRVTIYKDEDNDWWTVQVDNKHYESVGSVDIKFVHQLQIFLGITYQEEI